MTRESQIKAYLQEHGPCGASELARAVGLSCSCAVVQKLLQMEARGLIRRKGFFRTNKITRWALALPEV